MNKLGFLHLAAAIGGMGVFAATAFMALPERSEAVESRSIAPDVTYRLLDLPMGSHGGGRVHVIEADLSNPAIELYTTPPNPADRWPFRLRHVWHEV